MMASYSGHLDVVRELIKRGSDVSSTNRFKLIREMEKLH